MSVINITIKDKIQTISLPEALTTQVLKDFEIESRAWLLGEANLYIFDFKNVQSLTPSEYRVLLSFYSTALKAQKKVVSIHISADIVRQLKKEGVHDLMNIYEPKK